MINLLTTTVAGGTLLLSSLVAFGDAKEQDRDVGRFDAVEMAGFMDVTIEVGKKQSVRVVADADIIDKVETEVRNGTLRIDMEKGRYRNVEKLHVYVTVPELKSAELSGSGDMDISGLDDQDFSFSLRGSGDGIIDADKLKELELELRGSGDIEIEGTCSSVNIQLMGSGDVEADSMKCAEGMVSLRGSGDIEVYASNSIDITLQGSGNVEVYGEPTKVRSKVRGSGEVSVE